MSAVKHLLFDADGVLFHTDKLFSERIVEEYGANADDVTDFFQNVFPDCVAGQKDLKQELSSHLKAWHWPGTVDDLLNYWFNYEHNVDNQLLRYIGELRQKGITSSVATNNDRHRARAMFDYLNLDETVFDKLYASGEFGILKPDRVFFDKVMSDLPQLQPSEILFWDDSPANVEAAQTFGMQAEYYTSFEAFKGTMKRYV